MKLLRWFCLFINIHWTTAVGNESLPVSTTDEEFEYINKTGLPTQLSNSSVFQSPSINQSSLVTRPGFGPGHWPNGVVPYILRPSVKINLKADLRGALSQYDDLTCIRFTGKNSLLDLPLTPSPILFAGGAAACGRFFRCWERAFGGGVFNLRSCTGVGKIVQELGHILCMSDEETRRDRDKWIGYDAGKCQAPPIDGPEHSKGLNKLYDYLSVMHSAEKCKNGCILPKQPGVVTCGSERLSVLDIETINEVYNCTKGCHGYRFVNILNTGAFGDLVPTGNDFDGSPLYTCRAYHQGDIIPGKFKLATKECFVTWGGKEHKKTEDVEVLTNPHKVKLTFVNSEFFPFNAVRGGRTNERETLYIIRCQFKFNGNMGWFPGKFAHPLGAYSGNAGTEIQCTTSEFLTCERA